MSQPPAPQAPGPRRAVPIGRRAARVLALEFARHGGPTTGLLLGAGANSPVLAAAIDALLPEDALTVVAGGPAVAAGLRGHLAARGRWIADRVRVVDSLADADPADIVVLAQVPTGTAEDTRTLLDEVAKRLNPGGVLSLAVPATARPDGAGEEIERQVGLYGVGSDLVLRNLPPVRVHRLRYTEADPAAAERLAPVDRPSSVPLTRDMNVDSNGVVAAGLVLGLAALARNARPGSKLWLLPALAALPVAAFFRDPRRDVPDDPQAVVAASDGRVLSVERLRDARFGETDLLRIAVFLSVLDVHVNRSPVAGRVVDYFTEEGGYAAAMKPAAEHNVAAYTVIETRRGPVVVVQRTGLLARRIVHRVPVGSLLAKGERFGLIRFGSRTDVYLPADLATPLVAPGDRVTGGVTVIARWS